MLGVIFRLGLIFGETRYYGRFSLSKKGHGEIWPLAFGATKSILASNDIHGSRSTLKLRAGSFRESAAPSKTGCVHTLIPGNHQPIELPLLKSLLALIQSITTCRHWSSLLLTLTRIGVECHQCLMASVSKSP